MTISQAKALFLWGTFLSAILLLALTYDFHRKFPSQTHEEKLSPQVVAGKWVWQKYNCNNCHTILGIGGYYAPDVTKVMGYRDAAWMKGFLKDPEKVWPASRKMPNPHLKDNEIEDLIAFLTWVNGIDTNNWPPKPLAVAATGSHKPGEDVYKAQGCSSCHKIRGIGGDIGPDLTMEGKKRDKEWIEQHIKNPKSHNPDSIMPGYGNLSERDADAIADYLYGLR
jgi:nitric oxide reductase subunit C